MVGLGHVGVDWALLVNERIPQSRISSQGNSIHSRQRSVKTTNDLIEIDGTGGPALHPAHLPTCSCLPSYLLLQKCLLLACLALCLCAHACRGGCQHEAQPMRARRAGDRPDSCGADHCRDAANTQQVVVARWMGTHLLQLYARVPRVIQSICNRCAPLSRHLHGVASPASSALWCTRDKHGAVDWMIA